jgi:hypothetical protein
LQLILVLDFYNKCPLPCNKAKGSSFRLLESKSSQTPPTHSKPSTHSVVVAKMSSIHLPAQKQKAKDEEAKLKSKNRPFSVQHSRGNVWLGNEELSSKRPSTTGRKGESVINSDSSNSKTQVKPATISRKSSIRFKGESFREVEEVNHRVEHTTDLNIEGNNKVSVVYPTGETIVLHHAEVTIRPLSSNQPIKNLSSQLNDGNKSQTRGIRPNQVQRKSNQTGQKPSSSNANGASKMMSRTSPPRRENKLSVTPKKISRDSAVVAAKSSKLTKNSGKFTTSNEN